MQKKKMTANSRSSTAATVDILVTFYNQEQYVEQAINSCLEQKVDFPCRILVGDDGSTDNTVQIVKRLQETHPGRIELYVMDRVPGEKYIAGFRASGNRLNLLSKVTADYFIFLDGDDYFSSSSKLRRQVDVLRENPDCAACAHAIDALHPDGRMEPYVAERIPEGKYDRKRYWHHLYFHTDTILVRSSVIGSIPTKLVENHFNDNMITYLILQNGPIYYLPQAMAVYRQTGDGIWTGGKRVVGNLRNMVLYDISLIVNPGMKKQTDVRFATTWLELFSLRKEIRKDELEPFYLEAKEKNFRYSLKWICWQTLPLTEKAGLFIRTAINGVWGLHYMLLRRAKAVLEK